MATQAWSKTPSTNTATSRTWTWENDISQGGAVLRSDSAFTLRADGSGHFKTYVSNNDTFELHLTLYLPGGKTERLPNALGSHGTFSIRSNHREFDFGWRGKES